MHLIVQATEIFTQDLKQLAKLSGGMQIERINAQAFRVSPAQLTPEVIQYAEQAGIDLAWQEHMEYLRDYGLLAMDMDSTLITIECIDEIAASLGIKEEVARITAAAMRGEIDFAQSLIRRVALLRGTPATVLEQIYDQQLQLSPGAERLLEAARNAGVRTMLVSGGFTFFTERLKARLGLDEAIGNHLEVRGGLLTGRLLGPILDASGKAAAVCQTAERFQLTATQVIAIGDGANDVPMLRVAGASFAYHAKPVVRQQARYQINHGGLDAVLNILLPGGEERL